MHGFVLALALVKSRAIVSAHIASLWQFAFTLEVILFISGGSEPTGKALCFVREDLNLSRSESGGRLRRQQHRLQFDEHIKLLNMSLIIVNDNFQIFRLGQAIVL